MSYIKCYTNKNIVNHITPWKWWESQRVKYNLSLVIAGIIAFVSYVVLASVFGQYFNQLEITIFTTAFQAIGYLFAMIIANIFYFLGPVSELLLKPKNTELYRKTCFKIGLYFSVGLPFLIPLTIAYIGIKGLLS